MKNSANCKACFAITPMRAPRRKKKIWKTQRAREFRISRTKLPPNRVGFFFHAEGNILIYTISSCTEGELDLAILVCSKLIGGKYHSV